MTFILGGEGDFRFVLAEDVTEGDNAGNGAVFTVVETTDDGMIHFETSDGNSFDKSPGDEVFSPE